MRGALVLAASLCAGCAGSITGDLGGGSVPGFSDSLFAFHNPLSDGTERMQLRATTFGGACSSLTAVQDESERSSSSWFDDVTEINTRNVSAEERDELIDRRSQIWYEELDEIHRMHLPETFWEATLLLFAPSRSAIDGGAFDIQDQVTLQVCEHYGWPDHAAAFSAAPGDTPAIQEGMGVRCYTALDGDVDVVAFEDAARVEVAGSGEMVDVDGAQAGDIEFSLNASWCEDYEDELD
jgi:hypothetical protein